MNHTFTLSAACKSYPYGEPPIASNQVADKGWNVLANDLPMPLAVIRRSALVHNIAWMQAFAQRKGVALAPHGKTTMSPELFAMQLAAGAWGLSFATVFQASVGVAAGARRIVIANQVVCDADFSSLARLLDAHPDLRVWFLVDSLAQLDVIQDWFARQPQARPFDVLLEMGIAGQRTGCRSFEDAMALAHAVTRCAATRLGGIECYEGGVATCDSAQDAQAVSDLVRRVNDVVRACDAAQMFVDEQIVVSAGGSAVFDLVLPMLRVQGLGKPLFGVLRSGCYVTHDHGNYARFLTQLEKREGLASSLQAALEVWAMVQSVPEPGLALLTCGRRDVSYDLEMPIPQRWVPRGGVAQRDLPPSWKISALNDQHAYLRFDPSAEAPQVGDRVALGISHPCTTFDKWRWIPVVEDNWDISGAVHTQF
ncbi:amino acid deaminase [Rhodoferax aquaticus]|uniref:Amino acid deaminase n=1 Tax=Rhodoferax aquaticus TaxID=2527691 RepID=A0A515EUH8_9BURK|nr:amino acid deaminase [Rhodoferax aquaticus]QDL56259.1 amino acid deaminase [Rhodoferax aquaticus]